MKIYFFSNAPWSLSGYGTQTNVFVPRLKELGHEISIGGFYGLQGSPRIWNEMLVLPSGKEKYSNDVLVADAEFVEADIVITLMDVWVLQPNITRQVQWYPWVPIDCQPAPPHVVKALQTAVRPIAWCKFGVDELKKQGFDPYYVPLGVDTQQFKPMDRNKAREKFGRSTDTFVAGMVAANMEMVSRKCFDENIRAFAKFAEEKDDVFLYLHTNLSGIPNGVNVGQIIKYSGLPKHKVGAVQQYQYARGLITTKDMRAIYSSMDVLLSASRSEGFGLPIVEAQACGTPVIVTDFSAMPELVGVGHKIPPVTKFFHQNSYQVLPDVDEIRAALEFEYEVFKSGKNAARRKRARKFALKYDASVITIEHWKPVLEDIEKAQGKRKARLEPVELKAAAR